MPIRIGEALSGCMAGGGTAGIMVVTLLIAAAGCAGAMSGSGAGAMAREEAAPTADFSGHWEGSIYMMESSGKATLVLTESGGTFEGQATIELEGMRDTSTIYRTNFEGNTFQFWMTFEAFEVDVLAKGSIEEGVMKGICEAYTGGELADEGTFSLTRRLSE